MTFAGPPVWDRITRCRSSWRADRSPLACAGLSGSFQISIQSFHEILTKSTVIDSVHWDVILGHQFDKRLESFASCYSQSLLLTDFRENHTLLWFSETIQKIHETRQLESIHQQHIVDRKMWAETRQKLVSEKTQAYALKSLLKMPFKNSIWRDILCW